MAWLGQASKDMPSGALTTPVQMLGEAVNPGEYEDVFKESTRSSAAATSRAALLSCWIWPEDQVLQNPPASPSSAGDEGQRQLWNEVWINGLLSAR